MVYIHPIFFYQQEQSLIQLTDAPGGDLVLDELLAGNPKHWIKQGLAPVFIPKKLILSDWRIESWHETKFCAFSEAISDLSAQGFEVYIPNKGKLVLLNSNDSLQTINEQTPLIDSEKVYQLACEQFTLPREAIHVLDHYWVEVLLLGFDNTEKQTLRLSDFLNLDKSTQIVLIEKLKNSPYPIQTIIEDVLSESATLALQSLEIQFFSAKVLTKYYRIYTDTMGLAQLINNPNADLKNLHELEILSNNTVTQDVENQVLDYLAKHLLSQLTRLSIPGTLLYAIPHSIPKRSLMLTHLKLSGKESKAGLLSQFIQEAMHLNTININGMIDLQGEKEINFPTASKLVKVKLSDCIIRKQTLERLLLATEILTYLKVSSTKIIEDTTAIKGEPFKALKTLILDDTDLLKIKHLNNILKNNVNLEVLHLMCTFFNEPNNVKLDILPGSLIKLKELYLFNADYPATIHEALIKSAEYLAVLDLDTIDTFDRIALENTTLFWLRKLSINNVSHLNEEDIYKLIPQAPFLEKLTLGNLITLNSSVKLIRGWHQHLVEVSINGMQQSKENFLALVSYLKKLKHLRLFNHPIYPIPNEVSKHIESYECNLTFELNEEHVIAMLESMPKIKRLTIHCNHNLTLEQLKQINKKYHKVKIQLFPAFSAKFPAHQQVALPLEPSVVPYNHEQSMSYQPASSHFEFKYQATNKSRAQYVVIQQLCQYLQITNQDTHLIPVLNKGICGALCKQFEEKTIPQWNRYIDILLQWTGQKRTLTTEVTQHFTELLDTIKSHQLIQNELKQFLGDNLEHHLTTITDSIRVFSPWHAITVKRKVDGSAFYFYDPNQDEGFIEVAKDQLISVITKTLGSLLRIISTTQLVPQINNPQAFIAKGGLFMMIGSTNYEAILNQIPTHINLSGTALEDGLRIRDCTGISAWVCGLSHESQRVQLLTLNLLYNLCTTNPNYNAILQKSVEHLTTCQKEFLCTILKNHYHLHKPFIDYLTQCLQTAPEFIDYEATFETWKNQKPQAESVDAYLSDCIFNPTVHKRLINCKSTEELRGMQFALEKYCLNNNYPYFYIHSAKELIAASTHVHRIENTGVIKKGQGGLLYKFLQNNSNNNPVLLINYGNFSHETIVRFNDTLHGKMLGISINAKIIGLREKTNVNNYNGSDFLSRFDVVEDSPCYSQEFTTFIPRLPIKDELADSSTPIKLFHSIHYESILFGKWVPEADRRLGFKEGALKKALSASKTVTIEKGLWSDDNFNRFWQQALVRGYVECAEERITIPQDITLINKNDYNWATYKERVRLLIEGTGLLVLNPHSMNKFISDYRCDNTTKILRQVPGYIKQRLIRSIKSKRTNSLSVYLTRELDIDSWARLLEECQLHQIDLELQCAPGVSLPKELGLDAANTVAESSQWDKSIPITDLCLYSTDPDTTVAILSKNNNWQIIDISELGYSDLIEHLDGKLNNNALHFEFTKQVGALLKGLNKKQNFILKGEFSQELVDQLASLLLRRQKSQFSCKGRLVLIPSNEGCFNYLRTFKHTVSKEDKLSCLNTEYTQIINQIEQYIDNEPLSCLLARCQFLLLNPYQSGSDNAWIGMRALEKGHIDLKPLDAYSSAAEANAFLKNRLDSILLVMRYQPYVFLAGLSGVGKSTFVLKELKEFCNLFLGLGAIEKWAKTRNNGKLILLFIDEATLEKSQFSQFEGMYNNPPTIYYNRKLIKLSFNHKVIFAGNPVSYANGRQLATFFIRHGNSVLFPPIPSSVMYEKILKPLCKNTSLEIISSSICSIFLDIYRFLANCSEKDLIIGARELEMMLIMTAAFSQKNSAVSMFDIARFYAYNLSSNLVPQSHKTEFNALFTPARMPVPPRINNKGTFCITPSRLPLLTLLLNLIHLHDLRQSRYGNEGFPWQGLNCVVIEGKPGIGKSDFVLHTLIDNGFHEVKEGGDTGVISRRFYHIAPGMPIAEKEALLCKACDEGAWVLIDEFNSAPTSESLMNDLLMGWIPGKGRPQTPGFLVLITQNPSDKSTGRRILSTAFNKRRIIFTMPENTPQEMVDILKHKGLPQNQAMQIIAAFVKKKVEAEANNFPAPCFRDVLKLAKTIIQRKKTTNSLMFFSADNEKNASTSISQHSSLQLI